MTSFSLYSTAFEHLNKIKHDPRPNDEESERLERLILKNALTVRKNAINLHFDAETANKLNRLHAKKQRFYLNNEFSKIRECEKKEQLLTRRYFDFSPEKYKLFKDAHKEYDETVAIKSKKINLFKKMLNI